MDKITYLAELAEGLARWVPERERMDILRYYAEYFDEAGQDREAEVVAELGDPWALSCRLAVEGGYVTHEKAASWRPRKTWRRVLIGTAVGLAVFALVSGTGLLGLLAFNVMRTTTRNPVLSVGTEQATVVDWWMSPVTEDEFQVGYVYLNRDPDAYFMAESMNVFHSIDVDISLGNIEVVAGDDFTLSVGWNNATIGYEPTWEVRNGVLRLRDGWSQQVQVNSWEDFKNLFGTDQRPVDVIITVPQNMVLDEISVKTGLGDVRLYGLFAKTVTAESGMGNVECYDAREVRRMELSTGMGDVTLGMAEALDGLNIVLKTGWGDIDATLCGFETDYSYSLESGMGTVTVNGGYQNTKVERRGNQPYQLYAGSGKGDVNVYFTFS